MYELYENIKKYRKLNDLSQEELARLTGYTDRSSIAKIESGKVDLPQSKIMLFASALNIPAGTLMGNSGVDARTLSPDENTLIDNYEKLNDHGQEKAQEYVSDLTENDKYKKSHSAQKWA